MCEDFLGRLQHIMPAVLAGLLVALLNMSVLAEDTRVVLSWTAPL